MTTKRTAGQGTVPIKSIWKDTRICPFTKGLRVSLVLKNVWIVSVCKYACFLMPYKTCWNECTIARTKRNAKATNPQSLTLCYHRVHEKSFLSLYWLFQLTKNNAKPFYENWMSSIEHESRHPAGMCRKCLQRQSHGTIMARKETQGVTSICTPCWSETLAWKCCLRIRKLTFCCSISQVRLRRTSTHSRGDAGS